MTRDKDRKRIIRKRMQDTGESYTTARRHVVARAAKRRTPASSEPPRPRAINHAEIAGMSDARINQQTGHGWQEWVRLLDAAGAATMAHRDIARIVHDKFGVADWWSQTVTVGYERLKGLRDRGQRRGGSYEASKSKTFDVPIASLFAAWADDATRRRWVDAAATSVRTATPSKSMRLQWPDGTIVAAWFTAKGARRSNVALAHTKLPSKHAMEQSKTAWGTRLERLARLLDKEP